MTKLIQNLFIFTLFTALLGFSFFATAQVYTAPNYYYNNFDEGQFGRGITHLSGANSLEVSNINSIAGTHSLRSSGLGGAGSYKLDLTTGTPIDLTSETHGWEWILRFKTTNSATDGLNNWKYWLTREAELANSKGCYLTQTGGKLSLVFYQDANNIWTFEVPVNIVAGKEYVVRIQRLKTTGWRVYLDEVVLASQGAYTSRVNIGWYPAGIANYSSSLLAVSSTSSGRFQFDEMKMYSMKLLVSGANDPVNGISNPLYAGQQNAIIYGLKIETRGYFDIYQFVLGNSGNIAGVLQNNTMKLNRSSDAIFGNSDDSFVANMGFWNGTAQLNSNLSTPQVFYTVGSENGDLATAAYWYVSANVSPSPTSNAIFAFTTVTKMTGKSSEFDYSTTSLGNNVNSPTVNTGKEFNWQGGTTVWQTPENWSPKGVPGANDLAIIGELKKKEKPTISDQREVGHISFSDTKGSALEINSKLTVRNSIKNLGDITISGSGALDVKGNYFAESESKTTTTVASFAASNIIISINTNGNKNTVFNANGKETLANNAISFAGNKEAILTVGPSATLKLTGAQPFIFGANKNTVTLNNGSTVNYASAIAQEVNTTVLGEYSNIKFESVGTKKLEAGNFNVSGNWNSVGGKIDLLSNNPTLSFSGGAQEISDLGTDGGKGLMFGNVTFTGGNTKTLSTGEFALAVGSYLTMGPNTILQANDNLTFKASALGSASVSAVPANASIKGLVTVEKYIQGGSKEMWRTNRMLSSPVYDNTKSFINADGGRTYSFTQFIDDVIITGKGGALNGFDNNAGNAASAWTYVSGKSFVEIPTINTSLEVGKGAYIFYRGDRSNSIAKVTAPFVDAESIVMTFKGTLNQQDVTVPLAAANLLGNPYAATINWNAVKKTENVSSVVRVWNPSIRQYSTFNGRDGVNGGTQYIGPGQAFFVQSTGTGASVTFTESAKISNIAESKPLYNTVMATNDRNLSVDNIGVTNMAFVEEQPIMIRAKLVKNNTENSDETLIVLKSGELATIAGYDVTRTGGESVFLSSLSSDGKQMAINYMPHFKDVSTLKLGVTVDNSGSYTLQFSQQDLPIGYEFNLKDNFLNTRTAITSDGLAYEFDVNKTIAASSGMNRFVILINPITTLPVVISSFSATKVNGGVAVKWTTSTANNHSHFVVQRAGEDKVYTEIATVKAQQNCKYQIIDKNPLVGYNYYRLIQVDQDAKSTVNDPIVVKFELNETSVAGLLVYPTVIDADYNLKYNGTLISTVYEIKITDVSGRRISIQKLQKLALENGFKGVLPSVASGVYFVELVDISTGKSLGVAKLIKR